MPSTLGIVASAKRNTAFDPSQITGLQVWYDADDASTFTYSTGVLVTAWRDKSGNSRHLASGGSSPSRNGSLNGRATVVFDAAGAMAISVNQWPMSSPATMITVARLPTGASTQQSVFRLSVDGRIYRPATDNISIYNGGGITSPTLWGTTAHVVTAIFNGASSKLAADGGAYTTGYTDPGGWPGGTAWMAQEGWPGDIAEIIIYNRAITDPERTQILAYCRTKWGTP
jgi:hypothetical protein